MTAKIIFWICFGLMVYHYLLYGMLLWLLGGFFRIFRINKDSFEGIYEPDIALIIPAYNEAEVIPDKIRNTEALDYPAEKMHIVWITDGSTDDSVKLLNKVSGITLLHENERRGKIHAMNRAVRTVKAPIVFFTDANAMLNREALREMVRLFASERTGCVTGEKRISHSDLHKAVDAGEGLYWQYESFIKELESETGSVMGAVGELFAIRRNLYTEIKEDTLLDDFTLSLQVVQKGFNIKYARLACSVETSSFSIAGEFKRKSRIAAGGIQALTRIPELLHPLKFGATAWKFFSHKVLRWIIIPFAFPLIFLMNVLIVFSEPVHSIYTLLIILQVIFYATAIAGSMLQNRSVLFSLVFGPYYMVIMNLAAVKGIIDFIAGNYSVKWQKTRRA
jgi:cellulose synthase/poly-beta-1,6-N-acetylglucosamine synthase-like glycosyltransferase